MDFEVTQLDESCTLVRLTGRLDSAGVDRIETRVTAAMVPGGRNAVVDLSGVTFLASMGIRMLIANARAIHLKGRKMAVFGATGAVASVLEAVALDQLVPVAADQQAALQAVGG